jgi:hypothetical protein
MLKLIFKQSYQPGYQFMRKFIFLLPVLILSACITINTIPKQASSQRKNLPGDGSVKMKAPTESQPFVDTTDGLTYKWIKVRVYSGYPTQMLSSGPAIPRIDIPVSPSFPPPPAIVIKPTTGTFTDTRDGQVYKTVTIGKQTWMAQNLNFKTTAGCVSYANDDKNRLSYGLIYNFDVLGEATPKGWHVPTDS